MTNVTSYLNNHTMVLYSPMMEKISMYSFASKVYPHKNINGIHEVSITNFYIANIYNMFNPQWGYSEYKTDISIEKFLNNFRNDNCVTIQIGGCKIETPSNEKLLVTIKHESSFCELICCSFIYHRIYLDSTHQDFNNKSLSELNVKCQHESRETERGIYVYDPYIEITKKLEIFSIEVLGANRLNKRLKDNSQDDVVIDNSQDDVVNHLFLNINYDAKKISSIICNEEELGTGHRTSNGWVNNYRHNEIQLSRFFSTKLEISKFIEQISQIYPNAELNIHGDENQMGFIGITFPKPQKLSDIANVLGFSMSCSSYTYSD